MFSASDTTVALLGAVSIFSAIITICWPYLVTNDLSKRMRQVSSERERIRARERARLESVKSGSLRSEQKRFFQAVFDRFNLTKQAENGAVAKNLRQAGFRGQNPVVVFLAVRLLMPLVGFFIAALYVFAILTIDKPFVTKLAMCFGAAGLGYYLPTIYLKNLTTKRQQSIRRAWPDALDLLLICVESGMSIEGAFRKVSEEIGGQSIELAEELSLTTAELSYLQDRRKAYENLAERTGLDGVRGVVTSLIQSEKYGTPLSTSLRVLAQENRDMRMAEAEKKAAALPPKLTVPMILFFLPVLFAVIATPAAIKVMALN